jgi:hypothetical protein
MNQSQQIMESLGGLDEADKVQVGDEVKINLGHKTIKNASPDMRGPMWVGLMKDHIKAGGGTVTVMAIKGMEAMVQGSVRFANAAAGQEGYVRVPIEAMKVVRPYRG